MASNEGSDELVTPIPPMVGPVVVVVGWVEERCGLYDERKGGSFQPWIEPGVAISWLIIGCDEGGWLWSLATITPIWSNEGLSNGIVLNSLVLVECDGVDIDVEVTPFSEGLLGVAIVDVLIAVEDCWGAAGATINGLPPSRVQI